MAFASVAITAGSGTSVATDSISSKNYQIVKLAAGTESSDAPLGHLEDAAHGSGDAGIMALGVRKDTAAALAGTDGDYHPLEVDASGRLHVNVGNTVTVGSHAVTNAGTFAVQLDGTALTRLTDIETNTDSGAVVGNGAAATAQRVTLANDSTGIVALTTSTASIGKLAANSGVDIGDVDVTSIAAGDNNIGNVDIVTVPADPFGANADVGASDGSISAKLRFIAATGIPITGTVTVGSHAVTNAGTFAVQVDGAALTALQIMDDWDNAASDGASVSGDTAHDAVDAGEPVKIGAKAETAPSANTPVADADRTDVYADADGILLMKPAASGADSVSDAASNTDGAATAFAGGFAAAGASVKLAVTAISVFRSDAGTTLAYVDFRDGAAGAVLYRMPLPPNGGAVLSAGGFPLFKTSANTALAYDVSAALTTVFLSVSGFKTRV